MSSNLQMRPGTALGGSRFLANLNRDSDMNSLNSRENLSRTDSMPRRLEGRPPPIPRQNLQPNPEQDNLNSSSPPPMNNQPPPPENQHSEEINGVKITIQNQENVRPQSARFLTGSLFSKNDDEPNPLNIRPQSARLLPSSNNNDQLFTQTQPVQTPPPQPKGDIVFPKIQTEGNPQPKEVPPPIDVAHFTNTYSSDSYNFTPSAPPESTPINPQVEAAKRLSRTEKKLIDTINRSLTNFKQSFTRELSKSFRNDYYNSTQELDQFKNDIINETNDFLKTIEIYPIDVTSISNRIGITLDDGAKHIKMLLSDSEMQQQTKFESKKDLLTDYSRSLNEYCKAYTDNTKAILDKLNLALSRINQEKDKIISKRQEITRRQRSIKLKRSDLENTAARQKLEIENSLRTAEQIQAALENMNDEDSTQNKSEIYRNIDQEIDKILNFLDNNEMSEFQDAATRIAQNMDAVNSGLLADFNDINDAEIMAAQSIRTALLQMPRPVPMISFVNEDSPTKSVGRVKNH
ncbi:hypothetical protein TVAG_195290 [Trichomonas vaginalis G3]|uniref:Uncharacterized protein n=1 Tax=Trichomonas vaginalis (strain ATCC PRA-98 / G3) TaxID=412133 RepID=A2FLX9_TRIV3|nr:hypothetical protein TVAGG3_0963210 [Trichomonas vaginalis G3]EAX94068.1 hypothetical protein TVAG_195290 [Trichomonas vaginalis G3]KAI5488058.1 hypothetical protein TVAGG3_0963210 [Trichomonas vaginalis G3]|eukprot:XP_001306998.1 hypothetical protein [Trichomonas vaginalis G3]